MPDKKLFLITTQIIRNYWGMVLIYASDIRNFEITVSRYWKMGCVSGWEVHPQAIGILRDL